MTYNITARLILRKKVALRDTNTTMERFARYTGLTSPNKDETAVHGYGLTFIGSVVVLVSRKAIFLRSISLAVMLYVTLIEYHVSSVFHCHLSNCLTDRPRKTFSEVIICQPF